jgi:hypothetical protein
MKKDIDEDLIKDKVRKAYRGVDDRFTPSRFALDWECASGRMGQFPEYNTSRNLADLFNTRLLTGGMYGLSVTVVVLIVLSLMFINRQPVEVPVPGQAEDQVVSIALDPNNAWYMPTDDLLRVDVLKYEYQWVMFARYDPITMEIR